MVATLTSRKDARLARKMPYAGRRITSVAPVAEGTQPLTPEKDVKAMLRDIALVLHLTQKVKAEILAERSTEVVAVS